MFLQHAGAWGLLAALGHFAPAYARADARSAALLGHPAADATGESVFDLTIDHVPLQVNGRVGKAIALNGTVPGPLLRLREGDTAVLRVTNRLQEISSIHWHGVLLPPDMDGVPGVSFGGIKPGGTFTYRFPVRQSGTYWAHSHSGGQELLGLYFPLILDPPAPEPFHYNRDYVVLLSDWSFESPATIISKLKKEAGYYNFQKRTLGDFFRDGQHNGWSATVSGPPELVENAHGPDRFRRFTGYTYTYLLNGLPPDANWTGVFHPGEKVRLRCIAAGAMTYFDVRIPDLTMTVVQVDGQNVQPVEVDEFRIGPGETYDVLVQPDDRAYTLFAEAMDRSGYTRGTLAPRPGMRAAIPQRRPRPLRTMADMGMDMPGMAGMDMKGTETPATKTPDTGMTGHQTHGMNAADTPSPAPSPSTPCSTRAWQGWSPCRAWRCQGGRRAACRGQACPVVRRCRMARTRMVPATRRYPWRRAVGWIALGRASRAPTPGCWSTPTSKVSRRNPTSARRSVRLSYTSPATWNATCGHSTARNMRKPQRRSPSATASGCA